MDNIDYLLQSLDSEEVEQGTVKNGADNAPQYAETNVKNNANENKQKKSEPEESNGPVSQPTDSLSSRYGNDFESRDHEKSLESQFDFESIKKQLSSKYGEYGDEINKRLKEIKQQRNETKEKQSSWKTATVSKEKSTLAHHNVPDTIKNDVYAEPTFGLRIINPLISSTLLQSKMSGKHPVAVSNISHHLACGDKNTDWVFAGAVVYKSFLKTSQKGSQYCQWKISDLKNDLKQITLYLFGKACTDLWKVSLGTVAAILNAAPFYKDEKSSNEVTLTVRNADQVLILGASRDYGICKAKKKNGEDCTAFINKSQCEYCVYHIQKEYNKFAAPRYNLQSPMGSNTLRNKVLGKNEVFYAGKSYSAVNVAKKSKKLEKRNSFLLNQLSGDVKKNLETRESDRATLEKLDQPNVSNATLTNTKENRVNSTVSVENRAENGLKRKASGLVGLKIDLKSTKPIVSRSHLLEEATERVIQTGEVTRVTTDNPKARKPCFFADIFKDRTVSELPSPQLRGGGKFTMSKENDVIEFTDVASSNSKLFNSFKGLMANESQPVKTPSQVDANRSQQSPSLSNEKFRMKSILHSGRSVGNSIHEKKKARAKMEAIRAVKQTGGLTKINPNRVRPDPEKRKSLKRPIDTGETEGAEETFEKSVLSPRFLELMNTTSKHENLVHLAEDIERQNYFNKMEKKEQLEEKMLTTYKVPCKAVVCLKCKYKWFSASDLCKAESHPIKIIDTIKRFFKCDNCTNRTICLEMVPLISCKQCGSSKWSRTGMIRDKLAKIDSGLSIRGDEVKHLDSLSNRMNINLLVPDE